VPAGKERDENFLDDLLLADDGLAQLGGDARTSGLELIEGFGVGVGERRRFGHEKNTAKQAQIIRVRQPFASAFPVVRVGRSIG
jgi:hypothetical protein